MDHSTAPSPRAAARVAAASVPAAPTENGKRCKCRPSPTCVRASNRSLAPRVRSRLCTRRPSRTRFQAASPPRPSAQARSARYPCGLATTGVALIMELMATAPTADTTVASAGSRRSDHSRRAVSICKRRRRRRRSSTVARTRCGRHRCPRLRSGAPRRRTHQGSCPCGSRETSRRTRTAGLR